MDGWYCGEVFKYLPKCKSVIYELLKVSFIVMVFLTWISVNHKSCFLCCAFEGLSWKNCSARYFHYMSASVWKHVNLAFHFIVLTAIVFINVVSNKYKKKIQKFTFITLTINCIDTNVSNKRSNVAAKSAQLLFSCSVHLVQQSFHHLLLSPK